MCKFCHQARWKVILPYYFGGVGGLVIALLLIGWWDNMVFACGSAIAGFLGGIMLLIAVIATLSGLTVRKVPAGAAAPVIRPAQVAPSGAPPVPATPYIRPPMVDRLGSFVGTDEARIRKIDNFIRMANNEPGWEQLGLLPGMVERGNIPENTRETIDYLLDEHVPTYKLTLEHLFTLGKRELRETIIRILGAMGTENVLPVLNAFASQDPLRINEDDDYNATSGPSAPLSVTWGMPLRDLAKKEMQEVKARLGKV